MLPYLLMLKQSSGRADAEHGIQGYKWLVFLHFYSHEIDQPLFQEEAELNLVEVIVAEVDVHVLLVGTDRKQLVVDDHLTLLHL